MSTKANPQITGEAQHAAKAPVAAARSARQRDRGSVSIEFAIIMSAIIVGFFSLMIVAGRVVRQESDVRSAANAAARAASLRDDFGQARLDAIDVATENLADSGVSCESQLVSIVSPPGEFRPAGFVTVRVECTARSISGMGMSDNLYWYEATEIIEEYRGAP
ncbi:MAG: TadE/TadG family type IV pilus assembly protein [Acidimicrobiales bacterium]